MTAVAKPGGRGGAGDAVKDPSYNPSAHDARGDAARGGHAPNALLRGLRDVVVLRDAGQYAGQVRERHAGEGDRRPEVKVATSAAGRRPPAKH